MKKKKIWFIYGLLILGVTGVAASQQYDNLVKLIKSGASENVIIAYIDASDSSYNLSSDEIVHLKELGATSKVIVEAIGHNGNAKGSSNTQAAPAASQRETTSVTYPRSYEVYRVTPYWRHWRPAVTYWYPKNLDKLNQAFQIDVAGLLEGAFSVNYEYLLAHQHGLVLGGSYYTGWGWDSHGENVQLAYRWHFSRSMNSGFIGGFVNVGRNHGNESDLWTMRMIRTHTPRQASRSGPISVNDGFLRGVSALLPRLAMDIRGANLKTLFRTKVPRTNCDC